MFVSTRVSESPQVLSEDCVGQPTPDCVYKNVGNGTTFYVGNTEYSTLLTDFTLSSASQGVTVAASSIRGTIVDQAGKVMDPCDDYTSRGWKCDPNIRVGQPGPNRDVMPLQTLLRAAGIGSLDDVSSTIGETHRYSGLILTITVSVSNYWAKTGSFKEGNFVYTYSVQAVQDAEFKAEEVSPSPGSDSLNRTILDR